MAEASASRRHSPTSSTAPLVGMRRAELLRTVNEVKSEQRLAVSRSCGGCRGRDIKQ